MGKIVRFKKGKKKKQGWKLIPHWSSVFIARSDENYHSCDECEGPILKGFQYEKEVYGISLDGKRITTTRRIHMNPPCEMFLPPDDDDEINCSDKESFENAA